MNYFNDVKVEWLVEDGYDGSVSPVKPKYSTWDVQRNGDLVFFHKNGNQILMMTQDQWEELKKIV